MEELGCRLFLEMPPGHTLSKLADENFADVKVLAVGDSSLEVAVRVAG